MRAISAFIILSIGLIAQAQIKYQAYFKYLANDSIALNNCDIYLGERRQALHDSFFLLKEAGEYLIYFTSEHQIKVNIDTSPYQSDTFIVPQLTYHYIVSNPPLVVWTYGGQYANGPITDYYLNGNKRIEAIFEDGSPKDTFFRFYQNGTIQEISIYMEDDQQRTEFDSAGKVTLYWNTNEKIRKEFYDNGQIKSFLHWGRRYKETHFSKAGLLLYERKRKCATSYYHNGNIKDKIKRSNAIPFWKRIGSIYFFSHYRYDWETYDSLGQQKTTLQIHKLYTQGEILNADFDFNQIDSSDFELVTLYEDGKKHTKIEKEIMLDSSQHHWVYAVYSKKGLGWEKKNYITASELYAILEEECY